jgi:hypothetical protein
MKFNHDPPMCHECEVKNHASKTKIRYINHDTEILFSEPQHFDFPNFRAKKNAFVFHQFWGMKCVLKLFHKGQPGDCIKMWCLICKGFLQCCSLALSGNLV